MFAATIIFHSLFPPTLHFLQCNFSKVPNFIFFFFLLSDWGSIATINSREPMSGFPFSNVLSFADGYTSETSTGTPYFFVTDMEMSQQDLNENNQMSLSMTLAESDYCSLNGYDPQDPPCPRLILTGSIGKLSTLSSMYTG